MLYYKCDVIRNIFNVPGFFIAVKGGTPQQTHITIACTHHTQIT